MFVDASAFVAILAEEPDGQAYADAIEAASAVITSAVAVYETTLALARRGSISIEAARLIVEHFIDRARITIEPIDRAAGDLALSAFARFGKGRGHPAQLNLGDCFAYAMARQRGVPLLYKGEDFALTDIADGRTA